jgi:hypothetical protein
VNGRCRNAKRPNHAEHVFVAGILIRGSIPRLAMANDKLSTYKAKRDFQNVRLYTTTRWDGEKRESNYWIELVTTPQPFGRWRWWFVCPRTGARVAKLYLPNGASHSHRAKPTVSHIAPSVKRLMIEHCVALSKCRPSLERTGAFGITSPSQRGCAGAPTTASLNKSRSAEQTIDGHLAAFSTSSILAWDGDQFDAL